MAETMESGDPAVPSRPRNRLSRRTFLRNGTIGAAAAGAIGAVPGLAGLLGVASGDAPAVAGEGSGVVAGAGAEALPEVSGPIVAHVTDASTGEVSVYLGEREISYRDPALVAHLLRAAR